MAWAEWTATVLEAAGYRTLLQAWDFQPGSNFVLEMHDALRRSDRVIALLSEPYLRSAFAAPEWAGAFVTHPQGEGRRLLPLRVGDCQPDGLLAAVVYIDLVGATEPEARRRVLGAVADRQRRPTVAPVPGAGPAGFPGRLPAIWNVPPRNPNFAGRGDQLDELRAALGREDATVAVLAVAGLGGVGKTQVGVEHAWRRAADYDLVWWVPAGSPRHHRRVPHPSGRAPRPAHGRPRGRRGPRPRRAGTARGHHKFGALPDAPISPPAILHPVPVDDPAAGHAVTRAAFVRCVRRT